MATPHRENALLFTRELAAPRDLVFEMWGDPKHLEQWFRPAGITVTCKEMEFRPGGTLRIRAAEDSPLKGTYRGTYREIVRPERIVFVQAFDETPENGLLHTISFVEIDGKTLLTVKIVLPLPESMSTTHQGLMQHRYVGVCDGWSNSLLFLEQHLGTLEATRS